MAIKPIILQPYNPAWPQQFEHEANLIRDALRNHVVAIHHIGSTAVPGLAAKQNLDICLVVDDLEHSLKLQAMGYIFKGELNIPLHTYFSKNSALSKVNLHVVESGHHFIALNLCFRDCLRADAQIRAAYQGIKLRLAADPVNFECIAGRFPRYTLEKHAFINSVLDDAGYDALGVVRCTHYREWEAYHRILKSSDSNETLAKLEHHHPDQQHPTHYPRHHYPGHHHFVCLQGTTIVAAAHVELQGAQEIALRALKTDEPFQNQGYDRYLKNFLEKWWVKTSAL